MNSFTRALAMSTAAIVPLMAVPCYAQATAAEQGVSGSALEDIVVTAQKRSENLQKVPIVVTTVSGDQLAKAGITSLQQVSVLSPGFNSRQSLGAFQPTIRGIGTSSIVVENPVALYIDGVYYPQQREGLRELPDVQQIAVLKGPQGTLFGRNATGGVIQITTRDPTQDLEFRGELGLDNYATLRAGAYIAGGLSEGLAASLSLQYADQGKGYGQNFVTGNDTYQLLHSFSARGKVVFTPSDRTKITVIGDYMNRSEHAQALTPFPGTSYLFPIGPTTTPYDIYSPIDPKTSYEGGGISLQVNQDLGFAELTSITAYREGKASYLFDNMPTGVPYFNIGSENAPNDSFSQELQLVSNDISSFKWAVGAYYFDSSNRVSPIFRQRLSGFYQAFNLALTPTSIFQQDSYGDERTESIAPFGQVSIEFLPETTLTLGGRYTYEKRSISGRVTTTLYNGSTSTVQAVPASQTVKKPTWRIALDHQFNPDILGYVSYNRGFKSGGYNVNSPGPVAYLPEKLDAFEAGLKTQLLDRRIRFNLGGFYYKYNNIQVVQFVDNVTTIVNGAKAELYGIDVDIEFAATNNLRLTGGFEILHSEFTQYQNAVGSIPKDTGGSTLITVDATGNRLPGAQNFVGTAAIDYDTDVSFGNIGFNVTANYNGNYYFEADNFIKQKDYIMLNTSMTWTSPDEHLSVSVWGRNLANELVATVVASQNSGYTTSYGVPPRTYGLTARVNF